MQGAPSYDRGSRGNAVGAIVAVASILLHLLVMALHQPPGLSAAASAAPSQVQAAPHAHGHDHVDWHAPAADIAHEPGGHPAQHDGKTAPHCAMCRLVHLVALVPTAPVLVLPRALPLFVPTGLAQAHTSPRLAAPPPPSRGPPVLLG